MNKKFYFEKALREYFTYLKEINSKIDLFLQNSIDGSLKVSKKSGKAYYYHTHRNDDGIVETMYLNKSMKAIIKTLAQKKYYKKIKLIIKKELETIGKLDLILLDRINKEYTSMSEGLAEYVEPVEEPIDEVIQRWKDEEYEIYDEHPETLKFHTQRGEVVRSKSEVMIADMLYRNKDIIDYKYERKLKLYSNGIEIVLHPDFTIIDLRTGKIVYWEHAGRMDDPKYIRQIMWKLNVYYQNKLALGDDLYFSFESFEFPLDLIQIEQLLKGIMRL